MYEYRLPLKTGEEVIEELGMEGQIKYYKNFPRPSFQIQLTGGIIIKGVIADVVIRVSFPADNPLKSQENFEKSLTALLKKRIGGGENEGCC
jgi:hypothetical protein